MLYGGGRQHGNYGEQNQRRPNQMQGIKCFKCEKFGHVLKNCPFNKRSKQPNINEEGEPAEGRNEGIALTSTFTNKGRNDQLFIDSGATKQMTFQRNCWSSPAWIPRSPLDLALLHQALGDDDCSISEKDVILHASEHQWQFIQL